MDASLEILIDRIYRDVVKYGIFFQPQGSAPYEIEGGILVKLQSSLRQSFYTGFNQDVSKKIKVMLRIFFNSKLKLLDAPSTATISNTANETTIPLKSNIKPSVSVRVQNFKKIDPLLSPVDSSSHLTALFENLSFTESHLYRIIEKLTPLNSNPELEKIVNHAVNMVDCALSEPDNSTQERKVQRNFDSLVDKGVDEFLKILSVDRSTCYRSYGKDEEPQDMNCSILQNHALLYPFESKHIFFCRSHITETTSYKSSPNRTFFYKQDSYDPVALDSLPNNSADHLDFREQVSQKPDYAYPIRRSRSSSTNIFVFVLKVGSFSEFLMTPLDGQPGCWALIIDSYDRFITLASLLSEPLRYVVDHKTVDDFIIQDGSSSIYFKINRSKEGQDGALGMFAGPEEEKTRLRKIRFKNIIEQFQGYEENTFRTDAMINDNEKEKLGKLSTVELYLRQFYPLELSYMCFQKGYASLKIDWPTLRGVTGSKFWVGDQSLSKDIDDDSTGGYSINISCQTFIIASLLKRMRSFSNRRLLEGVMLEKSIELYAQNNGIDVAEMDIRQLSVDGIHIPSIFPDRLTMLRETLDASNMLKSLFLEEICDHKYSELHLSLALHENLSLLNVQKALMPDTISEKSKSATSRVELDQNFDYPNVNTGQNTLNESSAAILLQGEYHTMSEPYTPRTTLGGTAQKLGSQPNDGYNLKIEQLYNPMHSKLLYQNRSLQDESDFSTRVMHYKLENLLCYIPQLSNVVSDRDIISYPDVVLKIFDAARAEQFYSENYGDLYIRGIKSFEEYKTLFEERFEKELAANKRIDAYNSTSMNIMEGNNNEHTPNRDRSKPAVLNCPKLLCAGEIKFDALTLGPVDFYGKFLLFEYIKPDYGVNDLFNDEYYGFVKLTEDLYQEGLVMLKTLRSLGIVHHDLIDGKNMIIHEGKLYFVDFDCSSIRDAEDIDAPSLLFDESCFKEFYETQLHY